MKKNILLIIVSLSAFLLLQCQHAKGAVKDLGDLIPKKEGAKEKTDEDSRNVFSSSSETWISSSSSEARIYSSSSKPQIYSSSSETNKEISSSGSETLRKRKEAK